MPLQNTNEIDVISLNREKGIVTLGIIDSLEWENEEEHLLLLQEKINVYLRFIESGEIYSVYEDAKEREFEIKIYFKNPFPDNCKDFLKKVSDILNGAGYYFNFQVGI
ncbi:DUF6572 domain-containing protein [Geobacillus icigianus]|uniref:Uncharacterized protein n=1 Tax=Geobacillus subterraneus TaxID=129338 RepID=A0A679FQD3_9BACL|nr:MULTISPECIES: DUF6572 domain-containing protein [Geobacillus]KYD24107.1 hypothetical protein B4113_2600 [Geobacillus sp. B4113_201601]BBW96447.1 hypothetical protein GsuE55_12800 [Geobacillus subterraneus]